MTLRTKQFCIAIKSNFHTLLDRKYLVDYQSQLCVRFDDRAGTNF